MKSNPVASQFFAPMARGAWILAVALTAGPLAWAQQDSPPASQDTQQQQNQKPAPQDGQQQQQEKPPVSQDAQQGQSQQPPPQFPSQDSQQVSPQGQQPGPEMNGPQEDQRRVISRDTLPGTGGEQKGPEGVPQRTDRSRHGQWRDDQANGEPQNGRAAERVVPDSLTLPAGTVLRVRTNDYLSSDDSKAGQRFTATLEQSLVVNGWVVARRGETIEGEVQSAKKAGRVKGVSQLELQLTDLTLVDGQAVRIQTALWQGSGGTSHGADAATIATTTGLGAAIGAAANEGTGAAVGAGAGLLTGIGAVLLTRGRPTIVPPEARLSFELTEAVTIQTVESKQAYLPVRPGDYEGGRRLGRPYPVGYPAPPPRYCGYYRPCFARRYGYYRAY